MRKSLTLLMMTSLATGSLFLGGCARNISSQGYAEGNVGEAMTAYPGVIVQARQVQVSGGDSLGDNTAGLIGGGLAGGVLGSMVGKGNGNTLAMLGGAGLGALGGAYAEKALKEQDGLEYTVRLDDGRMMTVVQGMDNALKAGQRVLVYIASQRGGRSRVVPLNVPAAQAVPVAPVQQVQFAPVAQPVPQPQYAPQQPQYAPQPQPQYAPQPQPQQPYVQPQYYAPQAPAGY